MKKIFVGNFPFSMTESELRSLFEPHGSIENATIATDSPELGRMNPVQGRTEARRTIENALVGQNLFCGGLQPDLRLGGLKSAAG